MSFITCPYLHHDVWSPCIFSSVFKTASKIIIHPTFFYLLTEEVYFALSVNIYIVSLLPFLVNCYQEPHELLLLFVTPPILITTSFICMTIQTHTVLQKLCLGIKITTQGNYVTLIIICHEHQNKLKYIL